MTDSTLTGPSAIAHQETIGLLRRGVDSGRLGLRFCGRDEVTGFFTIHGLGEIEQCVRQGQFVSAHKPVG